MTTYKVTRCNGETTQFGFSEGIEGAELRRVLNAFRQSGFSECDTDTVFSESSKEALKNYEFVLGTRSSSDFDSHAAAGDIVAEILRMLGIEITIEMYREDGGKIIGACDRGTFLS